MGGGDGEFTVLWGKA